MKPRTRQEKEVVELSAKLAPPTQSDLRYFAGPGTQHYALYSGRKVKCTDCGHEWHEDGLNKQVRCPECGRLLKVKKTRARKMSEVVYCVILQAVKEWQVCRYFRLRWSCPVMGGRKLDYDEVVQQWINQNGTLFIIARKRTMGSYVDSWSLYEPMSLRRNPYFSAYHLSYWGAIVKSVTPRLKRNGLKQCMYNMRIYDLIRYLLKNPFAETLVKTGHGYLLRALDYRQLTANDNYVTAAKIVIRHGYKLSSKEWFLWIDLVHSLIELGKDIHNPHYICPQDLKAAHDRAMKQVERKREQERERRIEEQAKKDKRAARSYVRRMKKYFDLVFTKGNIVVGVLKSVTEFAQEGAEMHHCVFSGKYYAKKNSLIMSAKVGGKRAETVEVNLKDFRIVQCYGHHNSTSKWHSDIMDLVNANMPKIKKLRQAV